MSEKILRKKHKKAKQSIFLSKHKYHFFVAAIIEAVIILMLIILLLINFMKESVFINYINTGKYPKLFVYDLSDESYVKTENEIAGYNYRTHKKLVKMAKEQIKNNNYNIKTSGRKQYITTDLILEDIKNERYIVYIARY